MLAKSQMHRTKAEMIPGKVDVKLTYYFRDKRARDHDNYPPKYILDGLKGIFFEDDSLYHCSPSWELRTGELYDGDLVDHPSDGTLVEISEAHEQEK